MRSLFQAVVFVLLASPGLAVYYGETRADVLAELGKPSSVLTRGAREIFIYPRGGRIELEGGRVVVVQGIEVTEGPVAADTTPSASAPALESAAAEKPESAPERAEREAAEKARRDLEAEEAKARAEIEKAIDDLGSAREQVSQPEEFNWNGFAAELAVKALLMLAALKLTTKYWDFEVDLGGLAIAAGVDTGVRFVLALIGEVLLKLPTLFYLDEIVAAGVLVAVLRKVSHNKSLGRAVTIALTSKTFSIVVGSMVAVAVMQGLFG